MSAISKKQRVKGDAYVSEAKSTLSKKTWFASSSEQKFEDGAELYEKAANAYKVGGFHTEAGDAFMSAANIYKDETNNSMEAGKCLTSAGHSYKKTDSQKAISAFRESISLLCDAGRLTPAARLSKEVAELFETQEDGNEESVQLAIDSYQQAAELYDMEQQKSQSNQCLAKVAELSSAAKDPPDLIRASQIYESLGKTCLDSNLLKYNAKGYFLQCVFCHLANQDGVAAEQSLQRFSSLDYTFRDSREGKFVGELVAAVEGHDSEGFATACFEFDRISKLDPWKTSMLLMVRRAIDGGIGGDGDEDDIDLT